MPAGKLSEDSTILTFVLPRTLKARIQNYSEETGSTMSEIMRRAFRSYIASQSSEKIAVECKEG